MSRWLVKLDGDLFDVEQFPRSFPAGDIHAVEEAGEFFLVGETFESLPSAESVLAAAESTLIRMFAVGSLLMPNLRRPAVAHLIREHDDGRREPFTFVALFGNEIRARAGSVGVPAINANESAGPTQAEKMLSAAHGISSLENALELWGNGILTWPRLYRIVEEVEQHLGTTVDRQWLCTNEARERFMRTSNTAEASGLDARHAAGKFESPSNPMTIAEAREFVRSLLTKVLTREKGLA